MYYLKDPKAIKKLTDIEKITDMYKDFMSDFSFKPDRNIFPYPKIGTVIDEEKSVRWNREEVEKRRNAFNKEASMLNKQYSDLHKAYESALITALSKYHKLTVYEIKTIYGFVLERNKASNIDGVVANVEELISLYKLLLKPANKTKS